MDNAIYYTCAGGVSCRCNVDILECGTAWQVKAISDTITPVETSSMQEIPTFCSERVAGTTYDEGAIVCTPATSSDFSDNVYQCTNQRGCTLMPGTNSEW